MNDYIELRLNIDIVAGGEDTPSMETLTDVMAALLCDEGYESFTPDERGLTAYIRKDDFDEEALRNVLAGFPFDCCTITTSAETVEGEDWNSEWEKNYFQPIEVGGRCVIHSSFHTDIPKCDYDITIDPKMAFGTGHHDTTSLIIEQLLELPVEGKRVIDMGTGTGILAILAAMRGASQVTAIEIDPVAEQNAEENVALNGHPEINVVLGDASSLDGLSCDLFIANINRNIITADLPAYAATLSPGGVILLSGFYEQDIPVVRGVAEKLGLRFVGYTVREKGWSCLKLTRSNK